MTEILAQNKNIGGFEVALTQTYRNKSKHDGRPISHASEMADRYIYSVPSSHNLTWRPNYDHKWWETWERLMDKHVKKSWMEAKKEVYEFCDKSQLVIELTEHDYHVLVRQG